MTTQAEIDDVNSTRNIAARVRGNIGVVTEEEAAAALLLNSVGTLATWRSQGKGPQSIKLGKRVFYTTVTIQQWVEAQHREQNMSNHERPVS